MSKQSTTSLSSNNNNDMSNQNGTTTTTTTDKKLVAVIGGGVTGLAASWHLKVNTKNSTVKEVHLYEQSNRLGGHAWTCTCYCS
jgi:predicted NAD/FAD-binding protein